MARRRAIIGNQSSVAIAAAKLLQTTVNDPELEHQGCSHCGRHNDEGCVCEY